MSYASRCNKMRTTVDIPEPLVRQARAKAALEGIRMADVVNTALSQYLEGRESSGATPRRIEENTAGRFRLPLIRSSQPGQVGVNLAKVDETEALEEADRHAAVFGH